MVSEMSLMSRLAGPTACLTSFMVLASDHLAYELGRQKGIEGPFFGAFEERQG